MSRRSGLYQEHYVIMKYKNTLIKSCELTLLCRYIQHLENQTKVTFY